MVHKFSSMLKRTSLLIVLACVPTQYTHTGGEGLAAAFDAAVAGIAISAISGVVLAGVGTVQVYKKINNYLNRPSQEDCEQAFIAAGQIIKDDRGTVEFFEKLAQCKKLYGNQNNTLKYTDEKK